MVTKLMASDRRTKKAALALLLMIIVAVVLLAVLVPQMARANATEVSVSTPAQLRAAIENANVTRINLTGNITLDKGALTINRNKSSLVVDGNGFTLTQFSSNASADLIRFNNSGTLRDITFQNMNIAGRNNSGFVDISTGTAYRNITVTFDNVSYTGPMLAMAQESNVVIRNSNLTLARGHTNSTCALVKANNITFEGNVVVRNDTTNSSDLFKLTRIASNLVIADGANVDVVNQGNRHSGFAKFKCSNGNLIFSDNSTFNYVGGGVFQSGCAVSTVYIGNLTRVYIMTDGNLQNCGLLMIKGSMVVEEDAIVDIIAINNSNKKPVIKFTHQSTLMVNNPESFFVYNSASRVCGKYGLAIGTNCGGTIQITYNGMESIEYWRLNTSPHTNLPAATYKWENADGSGFTAFLTFNKNKASNVGTRDYTGETPFNATTATLRDINVIRIIGGSFREINFVTNGADGGDFFVKVRNNRIVGEPPIPVKEGYEFLGWYTDEDFEGPLWNFETGRVTDNMALYAKWELVEARTVSYVVGRYGNEFGQGFATSVPLGSTYIIKDSDEVNIFPTIDFLVIIAWNTIEDGSGTEYLVGQAVTITDNITLFAQWGLPGRGLSEELELEVEIEEEEVLADAVTDDDYVDEDVEEEAVEPVEADAVEDDDAAEQEQNEDYVEAAIEEPVEEMTSIQNEKTEYAYENAQTEE